ncbi:MAG: hypothetical protein N0C88_19195 [Candidatus Thiodiazotropha lotti]|uniref:Uncharacterized protein n=1 Tax=Candidatus Thiodiazotropha lotti TaxID=2792787 RepID=A0A9E4N2L6_9GAMM|nr:hypothetical protein [Candidatus Thiodiazotropha lotti]MCW4205429.1 hypothetical protein [Candidatus Thiodiazotropha lotti]
MPKQESGYYAVGISVLIKDAVICKSNRPGYASAIGLELPDYELIPQPEEVTPAKGCQMREMEYEVAVENGEHVTVEEFRILDAAFPMAYPSLHAIGKYGNQNGSGISFYFRLGAAKYPHELIWRKVEGAPGA